MNANEAISYIEACTWSTTRLGLGRTQELLSGLGNPQKRLKFIHVAGSNGKGSTCAMLSSILRKAGYRTGLYTSPYIQSFFERIQIDGENIPAASLAEITDRVRSIADSMEDHPSQFELVTAIAMVYFAEQNCDIVVLEVGMGGALDSTNVIDAPEIAVITNIGLEHTEYLGSTLEAIAETKGGIIKSGCACVAYPSEEMVLRTLSDICAERSVPFTVADTTAIEVETRSIDGQEFSFGPYQHLHLPLLGEHQLNNAAVALTVVTNLCKRGWEISDAAVTSGIRATIWPARMEVLCKKPLFLLDGGHNPQCAAALADTIRTYLPDQKVAFLIGVLADKDSDAMLDLVAPYGAQYICLTPDNPRALSADTLAQKLRSRGADVKTAASASDGIHAALETGMTVVAFGSLYLAGEIRTAFPAAMKAYQRRSALAQRKALSASYRAEASSRLCANILASSIYQNAETILAYCAFGSEADLSSVIAQAQHDGKRVAFPSCISRTEMSALSPRIGTDWKTGAFGIREPDPNSSEQIAPTAIDLVLCPCAGFDRFGHRVGMGAGYYDRYLPRCTKAATMIAAFEAQRLEAVFTERTDISVQFLATEAGVFPAEAEEESP